MLVDSSGVIWSKDSALRDTGWRGVDLKRPEYSDTEANEFIQGDLRDVDFVARVIQFKGEQGNFYNHVPYRLVRPFDEIYQFAADMGGAGFVFTGENDADIMHNSVSINLNVLEEVRKLNETFDGVTREWTEANRPEVWINQLRFSTLVLLACIQSTINLILITLTAVKNLHTPPTRLRIWMGETLQRASLSCLQSESWHSCSDCSLPQYLRSRRNLGRWKRESTSCNLP